MPDFSPIPSPSNNPLQNLKVIAEDTTIYIAPDGRGKTGSTSTWTGLTLGNDTTGNGTLAKPFATLAKAWAEAQKYTIFGNATLTIQFQKGIYTSTSASDWPDNLYHPQGGNIIIQGDAAAVKQRYLWQVANYQWDLSKFSGYGHTGDVYLWSRDGGTAHGFTAEDVGGYVAISNASLGSHDYYSDLYSTAAGSSSAFEDTKYSISLNSSRTMTQSIGNHFFNHKLPYEEGDGILGLAKISGATGSVDALSLVFKNANVDTRVPSFVGNSQTGLVGMSDASGNAGRIPSGLGNNVSWGGMASSYPEAQYSEPNGYYGLTAWNNAPTVSSGFTYPSRPSGVTHISDDVHLVTNFPVVIRHTYYGSSTPYAFESKSPLNIRGGKLKAIRNLMFVNARIDGFTEQYPLGATGPLGATAGTYSSTFSLTEANSDTLSPRPHLLNVEDSEIGIAHIGALGYMSVLNCVNSKVTRWDGYGLDYAFSDNHPGHSAGVSNVNAPGVDGYLYNTPLITASHMINGILCNNSQINFLEGADIPQYDPPNDKIAGGSRSNPLGRYLTDSSIWIQTVSYVGNAIKASNNSKVSLGHFWTSAVGGLPMFNMSFNVPVYPGSTSGLSAGFYNVESFNSSIYRNITISADFSSTSTGITLGRVFSIGQPTVTKFTTASPYGLGAGYSGSIWSNSAAYGNGQPIYQQRVIVYGYKMGNVNMHESDDWVKFLSTDGCTLYFRAYSDSEGTNFLSGITLHRNRSQFSGQNGSTISGTTTSNACQDMQFGWSNGWSGFKNSGLYPVHVYNNSELYINKLMVVKGGRRGLRISESSRLSCRPRGQASIVVSEVADGSIVVDLGSEARLGNVISKNQQWFSRGYSSSYGNVYDGQNHAIRATQNSKIYQDGNLVALCWPFTSHAFSTYSGISLGFGAGSYAVSHTLCGGSIALNAVRYSFNYSGMLLLETNSSYYGRPFNASVGSTFGVDGGLYYPINSGHRVSMCDGWNTGITEGFSRYNNAQSYFVPTTVNGVATSAGNIGNVATFTEAAASTGLWPYQLSLTIGSCGKVRLFDSSSVYPLPLYTLTTYASQEIGVNNLYSWAHVADITGNSNAKIATRVPLTNFTQANPFANYNVNSSNKYYQWWDSLRGASFGGFPNNGTGAQPNYPVYGKWAGVANKISDGSAADGNKNFEASGDGYISTATQPKPNRGEWAKWMHPDTSPSTIPAGSWNAVYPIPIIMTSQGTCKFIPPEL